MFKTNFSNKMSKEDFLNSISYLSLDDLNNNKVTLEKLKRIHPSLNDYSPLLYSIYLQSRPDLDQSEKEYYTILINKLLENEKKIVDKALKVFNNK
jgi:hypothetical protein